MIELIGLTKRFNDEIVFNELNLQLNNDKNIIAVIGPSGCGKTTLLKIISYLDSNFEGQYKSGFDKNEIAYLDQDDILIDTMTVFRNAIVSVKISSGKCEMPSDYKKILSLIELVGLDKFKFKYPKELSGGMKRRSSLVAAIVQQPKLLVLDEPMGGLDFQNRTIIIDLLKSLVNQYNFKIIMSTHEIPDAVRLCDMIIGLTNNSDQNVNFILCPDQSKIDYVELEDEIKAHYA